VNVEEFEDHLVFINEGSFIPESIERAMVPGYKPSYYRNPQLCDAMVQLDMIDTIAMGIPKIFKMQRDRYFPLPTYDLDDPSCVVVSIYGKSINESYSRLLYARPDLELGVVYLLDKVQKGEEVSTEQAAKLHEMGLVEGRWPHLTIASDIAVRTDGRAEYVRSKGLNDEACRQLILQMLRDTGPAKRGEILAMLGDLLPVGLTKAQKARRVSNLLADMKRDGVIVNERVGKGATWRIA
jgi:ATP-dependent DNA helicase RecG